jgi:hypothetical protein
MSTSPSSSSRIASVAFWLWVAAGPALVVANCWLPDYWWHYYSWTTTFFIFGREAEYETGIWLFSLLRAFLLGSIIYGPFGAIFFHRTVNVYGCLAAGFVVFALVAFVQAIISLC